MITQLTGSIVSRIAVPAVLGMTAAATPAGVAAAGPAAALHDRFLDASAAWAAAPAGPRHAGW